MKNTLKIAHRPLLFCTAAMVALAIVSGVGLLVDERTVLGEAVWLKPFKFSVSFALYAITLAWLIGQVDRWRRTMWWLGTVIVAGFVVPEVSAITFQAARGVSSHFNLTPGLDETVFMVMGGAAYLGWLSTLALGVLLMFQRRVDRAMAWAIPLGFVISLAGMSVGYLMTAPTPGQALSLAAGIDLTTIGAHGVGVTEAGSGMPLTGWETGAGDLRVAHFVGIHALQVLPLLAIVLGRLSWPALDGARTGLVVVTAAGYAGLTGLLLWQAQRGQSLIHPDAGTLAAAATLAGLVALAAAAVLLFAARRAPVAPAPAPAAG
ncbi:hypothetical protein HD597_012424 [Nonomuraea thailandensis]|uniref:Uncharacterized protein n=1 Tax=Nonomuraea thailandensis TaxID=1188745 RepID=A0A9X2GXB4_9ACTN|nr:hypothetical protein [Nonomuraea thailandensis]MCP2365404.1 hypothetical protein [Nonomuraea thailandensis]